MSRDFALDLMDMISNLELFECSRPLLLKPSKFETDFISACYLDDAYFYKLTAPILPATVVKVDFLFKAYWLDSIYLVS
jgi:hypothetical protein